MSEISLFYGIRVTMKITIHHIFMQKTMEIKQL